MVVPGASPLGTWESTNPGLEKLKSFIPHRLFLASHLPDCFPRFLRFERLTANSQATFSSIFAQASIQQLADLTGGILGRDPLFDPPFDFSGSMVILLALPTI
jgi:hypothetical protein